MKVLTILFLQLNSEETKNNLNTLKNFKNFSKKETQYFRAPWHIIEYFKSVLFDKHSLINICFWDFCIHILKLSFLLHYQYLFQWYIEILNNWENALQSAIFVNCFIAIICICFFINMTSFIFLLPWSSIEYLKVFLFCKKNILWYLCYWFKQRFWLLC